VGDRQIWGTSTAHSLADNQAPAFWVLADVEGNEACVTTWQGRDSAPM
jgi:4a-hydroxytetrahydrobiopterin dehydratase